MKKWLPYFLCLLGIAGFLFLRRALWGELLKASPKTFSDTPAGEEYAWNLESDRLVLTVSENGEEKEQSYYIADLVPKENQ